MLDLVLNGQQFIMLFDFLITSLLNEIYHCNMFNQFMRGIQT